MAQESWVLPPPGWYDDPEGRPGMRRYWDGREWTQHFDWATSQASSADASAPPQPLGDLSWLAVISLAIMILGFVWEITTGINYENKLSNLADSTGFGGVLAASDFVDARDNFTTALLVTIIIQLLASLAFLPWFHRAYRNVQRAGANLRFGTGWAVGAWFVPVLSWWRPKQIANDTWRGSPLDGGLRDPTWQERPVSALVHWWWVLYLLWLAVDAIPWLVLDSNDELLTTRSAIDSEQAGVGLLILSAIVGIAGVVLAIVLVRRVTQIQSVGLNAGTAGVAATPTARADPQVQDVATLREEAPSAVSPLVTGSDTAPAAGAESPRFCGHCGTAVRQGDRYCTACGNRIRV
jgi:hypothetical protein